MPPPLSNGVPLRVVLDTNVLLSLWVFSDSQFAPLRAEIDAGRWTALTSPDCLAEFRRVLTYPEFKLIPARQAVIYAAYASSSQTITDVPAEQIPLPACKDRDDQKFLELARDGKAHWLVTKDKALLKLARRTPLADHFRILTPEVALSSLPDASHHPSSTA